MNRNESTLVVLKWASRSMAHRRCPWPQPVDHRPEARAAGHALKRDDPGGFGNASGRRSIAQHPTAGRTADAAGASRQLAAVSGRCPCADCWSAALDLLRARCSGACFGGRCGPGPASRAWTGCASGASRIGRARDPSGPCRGRRASASNDVRRRTGGRAPFVHRPHGPGRRGWVVGRPGFFA